LLKVRFKNSLPLTTQRNDLGFTRNVTNLHTHGWHVSPSGNADNIFLHFKPGEEYDFVYNTPLQEPGTMGWYHPHVHGLVAEQLWAGLAGALVVEDESSVLSSYETHIFVLKDIDFNGSQVEPLTRSDYQRGKQGQTVMVNGLVNPVLSTRPGQVQRWRVLNASTSRYYRLNLDGHSMYLVGTDGGLLDRPRPLTEILLTPGERIDLLVRADQPSGT
jgi:FtsP/CotA-like multicopper oxidase with cupredoxin domain